MTQILQKTIKLNNGLYMPALGLGTGFLKDQKAFYNAIIDYGYRHIDTSTYTGNEKEVGAAVKQAIATGKVKRSDLFIATKIWHNSYHDPETALRKALDIMELEEVDIYYVHWPNNFFSERKIPMYLLW